MNEQRPLPAGVAALSELRCIVRTVELLARGRLRWPKEHLGLRLRFADGTSAPVFRETVMDSFAPGDPCVLVVEFKLRFLRGRGHDVFRRESLLNTPLFAGFPGFVSKLWLAHDQRGAYRGLYDWDGPQQAEYYARALWRVLALGSEPGSIHYQVLPRLRRDELLRTPARLDGLVDHDPAAATAWWRLVEAV
jgi:hypothetical protein